ncbi:MULTISPECIES: TetR/AcrR family transcriptional regulator [Roseobacteraceae]|uniref:TetR/AcrR family transcriptional regulator n=1 Tax=Roseobacteraceae TaxID=2854170 RepID=UPI00237F6476|nr:MULTISPECIES: TetR/AcrR family transcriptional regulator [Roseobacteraceae]MDE4100184.1 TetR/AcrR family transcriptional regulator [Phaeobacter gallaeciensis]MDE4113418.1 TetR/AcrR family transcriptional regulator [Phaeobacter gallaeciensis]MDE4117888.1 TetR/AcrR family transcriptional regulator [Phaeobacter gallaeciensis]MDE4122353.1 TetR/AcrR family transcriptional regulator [Phaeobacter gallaeciensis]MDF1804640.1 TetR/AcrR family transcriptional regulator [Thalassovita sp.]
MNKISWGRKTKDAEHQQKLKRRVLLDTAAHEFTTKGYAETSISELAELLDVSKPALYYYVKNKEDILLQCVEISLELIMEIYEDVNDQSQSGLDRLRAYFQRYAMTCTGNYGYALIREGNKHLSPENKVEMRRIMGRGQNAVEALIKAGIKDGSIAPCEPRYVAYVLFSTFNQMAFWYSTEGEKTEGEVADHLLNIVFSGIEPRIQS